MNYRDNNKNPYLVGHVYHMYNHHLEILEFLYSAQVLLKDIERPGSEPFKLSLMSGWEYAGPAVKPKNNREALSLLEKE